MSHYGTAPRRAYVVVHHTGSPNAHQNTTTNYCTSGYDFFVRYSGQIVVCSSWDDAQAISQCGCNCKTMGIMLNGCFGGCSSGNISGPSFFQECSLAFLVAHITTPDTADRLRPHANCKFWNPCGTVGCTGTVCMGTNFTQQSSTNYSWNANGIAFRDRIRAKRREFDNYGCCDHPCITP